MNLRKMDEALEREIRAAAVEAGLSPGEWVTAACREKLGRAPLGKLDSTVMPEQSPEDQERDRRRKKKEARHAELRQDCLAALPPVVPDKMKEKLATPPTDHHPACSCLRCQLHRERKTGLAAAPRRLAAASTQ